MPGEIWVFFYYCFGFLHFTFVVFWPSGVTGRSCYCSCKVLSVAFLLQTHQAILLSSVCVCWSSCRLSIIHLHRRLFFYFYSSVFPFLFGTHPKCSVHVFWLSLLPLLLSLLPTCITEDGQKGERVTSHFSALLLPASHACCISIFSLDHNILQCPLLLVRGLILPFLPALLSGVFQTSGPYQEPPGLALLSPLLLPICNGTPSFISSQQQLQEDKIATGCPVASQTVGLTSIWIHIQFAGFFIVKFHRNGAGVFLLLPPRTHSLDIWPTGLAPSWNLQNWSLCRWLLTSSYVADFSLIFYFEGFVVGMLDPFVHLFFL